MITRDKSGKYKKVAKIAKNCPVCGNTFLVFPCLDRINYCSTQCYFTSKLGKRPKWKNPELRAIRISKSKTGKKLSEEHRKALSGPVNHFWKGGLTPKNMKIRASLEYKLWRESVFKRDNYTCVIGGKEHGNRLEADHIKPFSLFPELRFSIDNGRTLCKECHRKTETFGGNSKKLNG